MNTMFLNLTDISAEPLHSQISRQLTEKIVDGDLDDGDKLMPIRTLARKQHVNVNTVRRAYAELEREGLIESRAENGFFVAPLTPEQKQAIAFQRRLGKQSLLNVVEVFSKELISVFDPVKLRSIIETHFKSHLQVKNVVFVLFNDQTGHYSMLPTDAFTRNESIHQDDKLLDYMGRAAHPFKIDEVFKNLNPSPLMEQLTKRDVRIIVPLKEASQLLGFLGLTEKRNTTDYTNEELNLLPVLANQFVTALTTARFYVEAVQKRRMDEELSMARQIQADLLPKTLPNDHRFSISAFSKPSQTVGGDFYDVVIIDENRIGLVTGDACGKGLPAAMLISQVQAMLKSEINNGNSLKQILMHLNHQIACFTPKDKFITFFFGIYDKTSGLFEYTSAGHDYPIHMTEDGSWNVLKVGGPALGIIHDSQYDIGSVHLQTGDTVFLYTDGVTESMNTEMEEFGVDRLRDILLQNPQLDSQGIVDTIQESLNAFTGEKAPLDDRTMLVLKVH